MNGSLKVVQAIILLSFVGLCFTSCGGSQTTLGSSDATSGTTTGGNTGQSSGTQSIEEEEKNATIPSGYSASNLFVTVPDSISYLSFSNLHTGWANRCTFTSSSVVNDLSCIIQVNELAIFNEGIKFQYNVPANSCKYIATYPYWYWNHEVGDGPKEISVSVVKDASGVVTSQVCDVDGSGPYPCDSATPPIQGADIKVDIDSSISVKCAYDNSDVGGVNCCFGQYHLVTNTILNGVPGTPTDERGKSWGGSVAACMGGAGKTSWEKKNRDGYPNYVMEKVYPNVPRTKIVKIRPTIDEITGIPANYTSSNLPIANYFTMGKHTHAGYGPASSTLTSPFPYYIDPISDRTGDRIGTASATLSAGSPYYYFDCLDEAFEVNNRIRVMVQEWDTVAALRNYITTGTSGSVLVPLPLTPIGADTGGPDEPGFAPDECPGIAGEQCNQLMDSDDLVNDTPLKRYDNADPADRYLYFPNEGYN